MIIVKGLYIHVPFCPTKCPYCDFYSMNYSKNLMDKYTDETFHRLKTLQGEFDTLYFGGGTPSLLGSERTKTLINSVNLIKNAEITLESNPNIDFSTWENSGINRLSLGLQSANLDELQNLGRRHNLEQVKKSIKTAQNIGIENISLDLMIGIQGQTKESLNKSIEFCASQNVQHISSYMLKIEDGTEYFKRRETLNLPDEDFTCELYLFMVQRLKELGFYQYEISNFSKKGYESRHNTKYWNCEEYEALGPSAHSYIDGKRYYFPKDLEYYLNHGERLFDSFGGDFDEFVMLKLRLTKGILRKDCEFFDKDKFDILLKNAKKIPKHLLECSGTSINLTSEGFLVSNTIISTLILD